MSEYFWYCFRVEGTCLYGVFDGHDGTRASEFAAQRIPAELLLGQLDGKTKDTEVRDTLEQAFVAVEKGFFQSIDDLLAQKANLQLELPEVVTHYFWPSFNERERIVSSFGTFLGC